MRNTDYDKVRKARSALAGFIAVLSNADDCPLDYVLPTDLQQLLQPIVDRLTEALGEPITPEKH